MNTTFHEAAAFVAGPICPLYPGTKVINEYIERLPGVVGNFIDAYRKMYEGGQVDLLPETIKVLKNNSPLGSQAVCEYCEYLTTVYKGFAYSKSLLYTVQSVSELAEEIKKKEGIVHIPIILQREDHKEWMRSHVVVITLDRESRTVEYYDSLGTPLDKQTRSVIGVFLPANEFVRQLTSAIDERKWRVDSNQTMHQFDWYNCGVHICWYMEMRQSVAFDQIKESRGIAPSEYRKHMVACLEYQVEEREEEDWTIIG